MQQQRECIKCGFHLLDHEATCSFCLARQEPSTLTRTIKRVSIASGIIGLFLAIIACIPMCFVQVPLGKVGVVKDHKGVPLEVLPPGRHVVNPFLFDVQNVDVVEVTPGQRGIIIEEPIRMPDWMPDEDKLNEAFRVKLAAEQLKQDTDKDDHE